MSESMRRAWARFEQALRIRGIDTDRLASPAASSELDALEAEVGGPLPHELREYWQVHDGEADDFIGLAAGFRMVSTAEARKICSDWAEVRQRLGSGLKELDSAASSYPPRAIRRKYSLRGWVPVLRDHEGNYVGVDLDPGPEGTRGQVINFGRDEDDKRVLLGSIVELMEWLALELEEARIVYDEAEKRVRHVSGRLVAVLARVSVSARRLPS